MGRSTFEGPILSGDNRFGPLRDVGYARLSQQAALSFAVTTNGSAGYCGSSGQFVTSNTIPNVNATVYTPSSSVYPPAAASITADTGSAIYRGAVFFMPINSQIIAVDYDIGIFPTVASGSVTSIQFLLGNQFNGSQYAQTAAITSGTGRQTMTYSGTQVTNMQATTADITNGQQPSQLSQVVATLVIVGSTMTTLATGTNYITISYRQYDGNIGSTTAYPYGNFD